MFIQMDEYNPAWPEQFQKLKKELEFILRGIQYKSIEHIGSTSVPGLAAKPIIDIDIVVTFEQLCGVSDAIQADGTYYFDGHSGKFDRWCIRRKDETVLPLRNVYVCIDGCLILRDHLAMRDALRNSREFRERYAQRKFELSLKDWSDEDPKGYNRAKTQTITQILSEIGFDKDELDWIRKTNLVTSK